MKATPQSSQNPTTQSHSRQSAIESLTAEGRLKGVLSDWPSRKIFDFLHQDRFTGQLLLTHRDRRKKIIFWRGEIVRIHSNLMPELFGHLMVDRGLLNEADLQNLLSLQREAHHVSEPQKRLGELAEEIHGVKNIELNELYKVQKIHALLQAMSWEDGDYEICPMEFKSTEDPLLSYRDVARSIDGLFDLTSTHLGPLFQHIRPWQPKSSSVDLGETPLWSILAGCRMATVNGILSIRKQNRLFEIVIKFGIPLILYEGTFGQPRQTIVVRQASEEHERFFLDQIFKLFSFLSGTAHFRLLADKSNAREERESFLQIREAQGRDAREDTHTRSINSEEIPFDLSSHFLVEKRGFLTRLKDKVIRYIRR